MCSHLNRDLQTQEAEVALQLFLRPVLVGFAAGIACMGTGWEWGCARVPEHTPFPSFWLFKEAKLSTLHTLSRLPLLSTRILLLL